MKKLNKKSDVRVIILIIITIILTSTTIVILTEYNIQSIWIIFVAMFLFFYLVITILRNGISKEDIFLRKQKAGEIITVLCAKDTEYVYADKDEKEKVFYIYSIGNTIFSNERKRVSLKKDVEYFIDKDGDLRER